MPWTTTWFGATCYGGLKTENSLGALWRLCIWIRAGIGNYLRTEILFNAKVNPFDRPKDLSRKQKGELARNTLELTRQAYRTSGVTNTAGRVKKLQSQGLTRRRYRFLAFDREREPCYHCGDRIERIEVSGRRIYLCRSCQPRLRCGSDNFTNKESS